MKKLVTDILKTFFICYGVYSFVDKLSDEKAERILKKKGVKL